LTRPPCAARSSSRRSWSSAARARAAARRREWVAAAVSPSVQRRRRCCVCVGGGGGCGRARLVCIAPALACMSHHPCLCAVPPHPPTPTHPHRYVKLLTQMFGERMVVANATGCSSIWGGSAPSNPYTVNPLTGRGPAWANSLFEDNAQFGLGIAMGLKQRRASYAAAVKGLLADQQGPGSAELRGALGEWLQVRACAGAQVLGGGCAAPWWQSCASQKCSSRHSCDSDATGHVPHTHAHTRAHTPAPGQGQRPAVPPGGGAAGAAAAGRGRRARRARRAAVAAGQRGRHARETQHVDRGACVRVRVAARLCV
jgi:hypothetical protein